MNCGYHFFQLFVPSVCEGFYFSLDGFEVSVVEQERDVCLARGHPILDAQRDQLVLLLDEVSVADWVSGLYG